jgi:hypothetical protein
MLQVSQWKAQKLQFAPAGSVFRRTSAEQKPDASKHDESPGAKIRRATMHET